MTTYTPDAWVVVRFTSPDQTVDKVMSGWYGGYGGSDEWRLSSGIRDIKEEEHRYVITNDSGSVYYCGKDVERMSGLMSSVYFGWRQQAEELMKEDSSKVYDISIIGVNECKPLLV